MYCISIATHPNIHLFTRYHGESDSLLKAL